LGEASSHSSQRHGTAWAFCNLGWFLGLTLGDFRLGSSALTGAGVGSGVVLASLLSCVSSGSGIRGSRRRCRSCCGGISLRESVSKVKNNDTIISLVCFSSGACCSVFALSFLINRIVLESSVNIIWGHFNSSSGASSSKLGLLFGREVSLDLILLSSSCSTGSISVS